MTIHLECFYPQEHIHERYRKYSYFHRSFMPMQQTINKHVNGISQHFFLQQCCEKNSSKISELKHQILTYLISNSVGQLELQGSAYHGLKLSVEI